MTTEILAELESLNSKTFKYNGKLFKYKNHKQVGFNIVIYTDKQTFNFLPSSIKDFLNEIELIKEPINLTYKTALPNQEKDKQSSPIQKIDLAFYEPTDAQKKLQEALLKSLELVQDDPKHIAQAKSVCEIANAMVNIEKNQIALMNAVKKHR